LSLHGFQQEAQHKVRLVVTLILNPKLSFNVLSLSHDHFNQLCLTKGKITTAFASRGKINTTELVG